MFFCFFLSFTALAQSEREKQINDLPKNSDSYYLYEGPESNFDTRVENVNRNSNTTQTREDRLNKINQNRKDNSLLRQGGEKDIRKDKENMSTLSFNLFLYIVDKFKED
ncbi:hypothetical protein A33Q_2576 [Indibacter alkaliphilus LW1]|uniref:Uncharacterized protein n=2 Tax=Indibacter TaxID=647744 RepID=S2E1N0_INDAL|nr:hypothetical protein A33Q_2576 [Indibacter alkaliphilus LW1]